MQISPQMNLDALRSAIGPAALSEDAVAMRKLLVRDFNGQDTDSISAEAWNALMVEMEKPVR